MVYGLAAWHQSGRCGREPTPAPAFRVAALRPRCRRGTTDRLAGRSGAAGSNPFPTGSYRLVYG
jgi:hypothetical protein